MLSGRVEGQILSGADGLVQTRRWVAFGKANNVLEARRSVETERRKREDREGIKHGDVEVSRVGLLAVEGGR